MTDSIQIHIVGDNGVGKKSLINLLMKIDDRGFEFSEYNKAYAVIIMFDLNSRTSFENVESWFRKISERLPIILVGNKSDLPNEIAIEEIKDMKNMHQNFIYYQNISVKENQNIDKLCFAILRM